MFSTLELDEFVVSRLIDLRSEVETLRKDKSLNASAAKAAVEALGKALAELEAIIPAK